MSTDPLHLGGGRRVLLVPWHAVHRSVELSRARELVDACSADPDAAEQLRALSSGLGPASVLDDAGRERLAQAIAAGDLVIVQLPADDGPYHPPAAFGGARPEEIRSLSELLPKTPVARPTWIELICLGEGGESFRGASLRVRDPEGGTRTIALDERSSARIDDLPTDGTCWIELDPDARPTNDTPMQAASEASARITAGGPAVGVRTTARHMLVVVRPKATCVRLVGMLFELNKSFLLPPALEGIRLLAHMYASMLGASILVVGHTDRTGKKFRNDSLSLERASAVIAYMTDDVDAWLEFYGKQVDASRRWGGSEDLAMLAALPREGTPYYSEEHDDPGYEAAVRRFQSVHGLVVDGKAGPVTRRALVIEYMALDGTSLPEGTDATAHGCGEHFPEIPTDDEVEELQNRRVEVFFFRDGIDPPPPSENSSAGSTEYAAWKEAVEQERTFTPSAAGRGSLLVVTDLPAEYVDDVGLTFTLRSVDGSYEQTLDPAREGGVMDGEVELTFTDVPRAAFLTLVANYPSGATQVLFDDIPYDDVWLVGRAGDDEIVDPFTMEPVS